MNDCLKLLVSSVLWPSRPRLGRSSTTLKLSWRVLRSCYEGVCQGAIAEKYSPRTVDSACYPSSKLQLCMRFQSGLRNLHTWVQAHRIGSRSPNRKIFSFAGALFSLLSFDFLPHGLMVLLNVGVQGPFLLICSLPGSRPATPAAVRTRGAVAMWTAPFFS